MIKLSHGTIYNWIRRFVSVLENFVNRLEPKVSPTWNADEMMIKSKGRFRTC